MKVFVLSRVAADDLVKNGTWRTAGQDGWEVGKPWSLVSISSEASPVLDIERLANLGCKRVLPVYFMDVTPEQVADDPRLHYGLFTEDQAEIIADFISGLPDPENHQFVVHCAAGVSRSAAVGVYACRLWGLDPFKELDMNGLCPNYHVLKLLEQAIPTGEYSEAVKEKWWDTGFTALRRVLGVDPNQGR